MRLSDWPKRGAQPMRIPGDPRLRPIRDFGALGFGVTSQRSGDGRGAEWRAGQCGEPAGQVRSSGEPAGPGDTWGTSVRVW